MLLAGFSLLGLIHREPQRIAEELVRHFHLNPAHRFPRIFVDAITHTDPSTLVGLACGAFAYAALRLIEGIGLWREKRWAQWLGVASGATYLPIEVYEILHGITWPKLLLLVVNTLCVLYLVQTLRRRESPPVKEGDQS